MRNRLTILFVLGAVTIIISGFSTLIDVTRFSEFRLMLHDQTMYVLRSKTPNEIKIANSATDDLLVLRYNSLTKFGSDSTISTCNKLFNDSSVILIDRISTGVVTSYYAVYLKPELHSTKVVRYRIEGASAPVIDTLNMFYKVNVDSLFAFNDSISYHDIVRNNYTVLSTANKQLCRVKISRNSRFNSWFDFQK